MPLAAAAAAVVAAAAAVVAAAAPTAAAAQQQKDDDDPPAAPAAKAATIIAPHKKYLLDIVETDGPCRYVSPHLMERSRIGSANGAHPPGMKKRPAPILGEGRF